MSCVELTIEKLVYGGDGLARLAPDGGQPRAIAVFVPYVLPAERVEASLVEERTKIYTDFDSAVLAAAGGLWTFLGGLTVIARFRQWRLRRMQRSSAQRAVQPGSGA